MPPLGMMLASFTRFRRHQDDALALPSTSSTPGLWRHLRRPEMANRAVKEILVRVGWSIP